MQRLFFNVAVVLSAIVLYVAWPLVTAWQLREAIKRGDAAAIERMVEWEKVRETLKSSLAKHTQLLPDVTAAGEANKPTLWQRAKAAVGTTVIDNVIDGYVTPEGLPKLFAYRKMWKEQAMGEADEAKTLPWHQRFARFYSRIKRAEFHSLTQIEIEMADKAVLGRHYVSVLELKDFRWKLTSLQVVTADAAVPH